MSKKEAAQPVEPAPFSDEEEAAISVGIAADPDAFELDEEWFKNARPAAEVYPELKYGIKPKFGPEIIERMRRTEPEKARRLEAYNREMDEVIRKNWSAFKAEHPERARELEGYSRQFEKSEHARKNAAAAPKAEAG